MAVTYYKS